MASGVESPISSVMALMRDLSMPLLAHMVDAIAAPAARRSRRVMERLYCFMRQAGGSPVKDLRLAFVGAVVGAGEEEEAGYGVAGGGDEEALVVFLGGELF